MHTLDIVLNGRLYRGLVVPERCTVGIWRELIRLGLLGVPLPEAMGLACRAEAPEEGGPRLDDMDALPEPPHLMHLTGPHGLLRNMELLLLNAMRAADAAGDGGEVPADPGARSASIVATSPDAAPDVPAHAPAAAPASGLASGRGRCRGGRRGRSGKGRGRSGRSGPGDAAMPLAPMLGMSASRHKDVEVVARRALSGDVLANVSLRRGDLFATIARAVHSQIGGAKVQARLFHGSRRLHGSERQSLDVRLANGDAVDIICRPCRLLTGSADGTAKIWSGEECVHTLRGHDAEVLAVAASPLGDVIATGSADGTARLWDPETGDCKRVLEAGSPVNSIAFSPTGSHVLCGCGCGDAAAFSAATGVTELTLQGHCGSVYAASWSPDGELIVTASADHTAKLWHGVFGECMETLRGHRAVVRAAAFSRMGFRVVTCSWDRTVKIWDVAGGACLATLKGHTSDVLSACFSPDLGAAVRVLTASADRSAKVWSPDADGRPPLLSLEGHTDAVRAASFSPDGRAIVTASSDRKARIWDAESGEMCLILEGHSGKVTSAVFVE